MRIIMITNGSRTELAVQTVVSMHKNAANWSSHHLRLVFDGGIEGLKSWLPEFQRLANSALAPLGVEALLWGSANQSTEDPLGVGGAKNYGADISIFGPQLRNSSDILMFSDDDMYYLPGWDHLLEIGMNAQSELLPAYELTQLGGWRHPYHRLGRTLMEGGWLHLGQPHKIHEVDAVTGNCFVIRWSDWLKYGPFDSNAIGPGQSEDYALSQRIRAGGGLVATLDPPVAIHCGLVNSVGEPATGWREMEDMITEQLAELSPEMRDSVLIMRPAPTMEPLRVMQALETARMLRHFDGLAVGPNTVLPDGRTITEAGLQPGPIVASRYAPGGSFSRQFVEDADRAFEQARRGLDMQPRNAPRQPRVYSGEPLPTALNIASGQRPFRSTTELIWYNVDRQRVPPDRIPDIMCNVGVDPLPFSDNSVRYVVIHQGLEHAGCGESEPMLRECWRVLARGGSLIITVPDMHKLAARWLGGEMDTQLYMTAVYGAYMGDEADRHKWGFDVLSLLNYLGTTLLPEVFSWTTYMKQFDWRTIPGADIARDWWVLGVEVVKP